MRFIFAFLFFTGLYFQGYCQKYSFVSYNPTNGLPQSQVTALTQDPDGYLWVGTLGGLAKFNGKDFVTYTTEDGLLNNRISFLTIIDNNLWVGHEGGVSCFNKSSFKNWTFKGDEKTNKVSSVVKFKGKILISSNGGGLYTIENNKIKNINFINEKKNYEYINVRDMLVYNNELFLATRNGVIFTKDLNKFKNIDSLYDYNTAGIELWGSDLIISTSVDGLFVCNPLSKKIKQIHFEEDLFHMEDELPLKLRGIHVDSKRNCWISTNYGVAKLGENRRLKIINESKGLPFQDISSVFEDRSNNIWFGTMGKGLLRFPGERFVYYNQSDGLSSDLVMCANQDKYGNLWFGTLDKGVIKMATNGAFSFYEFPNNRIWSSIFNVDDYNWFATDEGLAQVSADGSIKMFYTNDGMPGERITAMYKVNSGEMFIGGTNGVSLYKRGKFTLIKSSVKHDLGTISDFSFHDNELFCGSSKGLYVYRKGEFVKIKDFQKSVSCIEKDESNNLWIGTEEGLFIYSGNKITSIFLSSTPSTNMINFLNFHNEKLYIGTNNGLVILSNFKNSKEYNTLLYGIKDGLVDLETNLNSCFFDKSGRLWFGTSLGLVRYEEPKYHEASLNPKIHLKSILLNYETFPYSKYSTDLDEKGLPTSLILPYSKNNVEFEVDGVSLRNHENLSYQFWLEGMDETWSPKSKNPIISFTGLNANSYILHVRAVDDRGLISSELVLPFDVTPAFYKSWWFIFLMISILGFVVVQLFRFKLKREREKSHNEMIEYKSKLMALEQKSLNASMNRHFIFNSLNSIQYFINSQDRLSANRYLTNFAKLIRKNLDSTNEEGNLISLTQELEGLELYLSLEAMRFKNRFDYKINCESVDTDSIIIPAMLLQPFIENCIIHGILPNEDKKGMISITIKEEEANILTVQIDDNGVGIKNSILKKSENIGDHRSQGMEITTKRIDLIKKISNKGFELIGPFQIDEIDSSINGTRVLLKIPFENLED